MASLATTVGTSELATMLGISRQRVNELGRQGKISREPDGKWNPDKVRAALGKSLDGRQQSPARDRAEGPEHNIGQHREGSQDGAEPPKGTLLYEQWRLTREKADRERQDRLKDAGELLDRGEVKAAVSSMIGAAKNKLITIADELCDKLAATSDPVRCRELVDDRIHQALSELAEWPARA
ncbi:MAG: hypothetical protein ABFD60_06700 [Bryobacteraceae bacterium]